MKRTFTSKLVWAVLFLGNFSLSTGQAQEEMRDLFPPGEEGAQALIEFVLEADEETRAQLSWELVPDQADCEALFQDRNLALEVFRYQRYLSRRVRVVITPHLDQQTHWVLWWADANELTRYEGETRNFPGGYHELASYLRPEVKLYRFKFIEPGRRMGSSYDVLVHVNGHWCMVHRPWVVLLK